MSSSTRNPLALLRALVIVLFVSSIAKALNIGPNTVVKITNDLESSLSLEIHCKDKNSDLGVHQVPSGGNYQFTINALPRLGNVLYFCGFTWNNKLHWFDIYVQSRDESYSYLPWSIREGGPCFYVSTSNVKCYSWN